MLVNILTVKKYIILVELTVLPTFVYMRLLSFKPSDYGVNNFTYSVLGGIFKNDL